MNNSTIYHDEITQKYQNDWKQNVFQNEYTFFQNDQQLEFLGIQKSCVHFIINTCEHLSLSSEIIFRSLDNFDLYFYRQFIDVKNKIESSTNMNKEEMWLNVFNTIKVQFPLRAFSIIQIVTKYVDSRLIFSTEIIEELLEKNEVKFAKLAILKSEIRVFKYLNYQVLKSLSYETIELLLRICENILPSCCTNFRKVCFLILQHAYSNRDQIYSKLETHLRTHVSFVELKADKILLGAAVVLATAVKFNLSKLLCNNILRVIVAEIPNTENDIASLACAILATGIIIE